MHSSSLPRWLVTLIAASPLACQFVTPGAPSGQADAGAPVSPAVFVPELRYEDDRLYATIVVPGGSSIDAKLVGAGAPSEPLHLSATCESLPWKEGEGYNTKVLRPDDACSFALPRGEAKAGSYSIELTSGGAKVAETSFSLVEVPGAGGGHALVVDPALRKGKAYARDGHFFVWLPIDASLDWRTVAFYVVSDGALAKDGAETASLTARRVLHEGDPIADLAIAEFELPRERLGNPLEEKPVAMQIVAYVGMNRVGAWAFSWGPVLIDASMYQFRPIDGQTFGSYVVVGNASGDGAQGETLAAKQKELLAETSVDYGKKHPIGRYGKRFANRTCAVFGDANAMKLAGELETARQQSTKGVGVETSESIGSVNVGGSSVDVSVDTGGGTIIEALPRWDDGSTPYGVSDALKTRRSSPADVQYATKLKQLDARSARYGADCMAKLTAGIDWLIPAPEPEEPAQEDLR